MIRVLYDILRAASAAQPQKTAVFCKRDSMTYGELDAAARGMAGTLVRFGVRKGDRVSVYLEKGIEEVISFWGITLAGGVFVPIRPGLTTGQAAHILEDSGAAVLITDPGRARALRDQTPVFGRLSLVVCGGERDRSAQVGAYRGGLCSWNEAVSGKDSETGHYSRVIDTDLATILYTSGSTGKPKGVVLSHLNVVEGSKRVSEYLAITEEDRLLSILSFGFDYGLNQLTTAFLHRAQIVLFDPVFPKHIVEISRRMDVTGIAAVSTTWMQLLQAPWDQSQLPRLRYVTNSGGAIPRESVLELRRRLPRTSIFLMYGLTEAFRSTYLDPGLVEQYPTSIGRAIPGEEILVLDESGQAVQEGGVGELVHRGVLVAQGYWNTPELTASRFRPDPLPPPGHPDPPKVVYSGDQVKVGEGGLLFFVGRKDELIKCAGNRISPAEVEEIVYASGLVDFAVAFGEPHPVFGHRVGVVAVPRDTLAFDREALLGHCRRNMPSYMVPETILVRGSLPTTSNGKLDRARIKAEALASAAGSAPVPEQAERGPADPEARRDTSTQTTR
jgi:acyl-CoA ligase (AMP-forming) (exosortase A-associated)